MKNHAIAASEGWLLGRRCFVTRGVGGDRDRWKAFGVELVRHEPGMRDRNAKAEGPHGFWIRNRSQRVVDDSSCQYVVAGDEFAEFPRVVSAPPAPADVPIVGRSEEHPSELQQLIPHSCAI